MYSCEKKFKCPKILEPDQDLLEKSIEFLKNNWATVVGVAVGLAALPGFGLSASGPVGGSLAAC